jgi:hypothetical protein
MKLARGELAPEDPLGERREAEYEEPGDRKACSDAKRSRSARAPAQLRPARERHAAVQHHCEIEAQSKAEDPASSGSEMGTPAITRTEAARVRAKSARSESVNEHGRKRTACRRMERMSDWAEMSRG